MVHNFEPKYWLIHVVRRCKLVFKTTVSIWFHDKLFLLRPTPNLIILYKRRPTTIHVPILHKNKLPFTRKSSIGRLHRPRGTTVQCWDVTLWVGQTPQRCMVGHPPNWPFLIGWCDPPIEDFLPLFIWSLSTLHLRTQISSILQKPPKNIT